MKKVLLLAFCIAAMLTVEAQPTVTNSWTKSQTDVLPVANVNNSNPVAVTAQGDVYATGLFSKKFSFAGKNLEPSTISSYLLKYGADGTEKWGVALEGTATIKAITTDDAGNVYIAGNFADVLTFGSTDGNTQVKEGMMNGDAYVPEQVTGFVAKYDANGALKSVQSFIPKVLPELETNAGYQPDAGALYFNINNLAFSNGKLYASALFTGLTEVNGFSFKGNYLDTFEMGFLFADLASGAIFAMNDELNVNGIVANMAVNGAQTEAQMAVYSASFAISGGKLYSGFVANGSQVLTIGTQSQNFDFLMSEDGDVEYGYVLSIIDLSTGVSSLTEKYITAHDILPNSSNIKSMFVKDDILLLGGTFIKQLPFDENKLAVSTNDIYVVGLNTSTLAVNWSATSAFNEGEIKKKNEIFSGMTVIGDYVYAIGYSSNVSTAPVSVVDNSLVYWVDTTNGTMTRSDVANLTTGVTAFGTKLAIAQTQLADQKLENIFSLNEVSNATGISSTEQGAGVSVYPNPVVDVLNFTTPCDVAIINLMGVTVKQAENVSSLPVSDLISGQYIIKLTTEDGTSTAKVIKK